MGAGDVGILSVELHGPDQLRDAPEHVRVSGDRGLVTHDV